MSCQNKTAPINIEPQTKKTCELKCQYAFKYHDSHINISNKGDYLLLNYEPNTISPVKYNSENYQVEEMRIYQPSLHSYSGVKADAELLVIHNSGTNKLIVSIPVVASLISTDNLLNKVLKSYNATDNQTDDLVQTNITNFNLNDFVPLNQFYSYKGTLPFEPCNGLFDYIVFSKDEGNYISIQTNTLNTLKDTIASNDISTVKNVEYFFNKKGSSTRIGKGGKEDDIYIECLPTDSNGEVVVNAEDGSDITKDAKKQVSELYKDYQVFVHIILGIILMYIILVVVHSIANFSNPLVEINNMVKKINSVGQG